MSQKYTDHLGFYTEYCYTWTSANCCYQSWKVPMKMHCKLSLCTFTCPFGTSCSQLVKFLQPQRWNYLPPPPPRSNPFQTKIMCSSPGWQTLLINHHAWSMWQEPVVCWLEWETVKTSLLRAYHKLTNCACREILTSWLTHIRTGPKNK